MIYNARCLPSCRQDEKGLTPSEALRQPETRKRPFAGFTLIELLIVIIIVGILAALALPKYGIMAERSRQAEATSILGALRGAQIRFQAENNTYAAPIGNLDVELTSCTGGPPAAACQGKYFNYTVPGAPTDADLADAYRNGEQKTGGEANYQFRINRNGNITCETTTGDKCAGGP